MNSLGITGTEQIFLGVYLIAHGLIHIIFLFYFKDNKTNVLTGWSGKSWLLNNLLSDGLIKLIGRILWISVAILFTVSGLAVIDLIKIGDSLTPLLILTCIVGIIPFVIFFKDLYPTPYHWILGLLIDVIILAFILLFSNQVQFLLILLIAIWLYGMFIHTKIISQFTSENTSNQ